VGLKPDSEESEKNYADDERADMSNMQSDGYGRSIGNYEKISMLNMLIWRITFAWKMEMKNK
jgi:hypothetical protein